MLPVSDRINQLENEIASLNRSIKEAQSELDSLEQMRERKESELVELEDKRMQWTDEEWETDAQAQRQRRLIERRYGKQPHSIADWWTAPIAS